MINFQKYIFLILAITLLIAPNLIAIDTETLVVVDESGKSTSHAVTPPVLYGYPMVRI